MEGLVKEKLITSIENDIDNESKDDVIVKVESVIETFKKTKKLSNFLSTFKIYQVDETCNYFNPLRLLLHPPQYLLHPPRYRRHYQLAST